jgi:predicted dehydrogenase
MARTTKKAATKAKAGATKASVAAKSPAGKAKPAAKPAGKAKDLSNRKIAAPKLAYQPRDPRSYRPNIGLIACGGITSAHLRAYKAAGYKVVALCDLIEGRALKRQEEFYPKADVYVDYRDVLARPDIEVVDIATHPKDREPLLEAALRAGKHVLSQKPFVLDLDFGQKLIKLADRKSVKLAVNQNGRWSPPFAYARGAISAGLLGEVFAAHLSVHWDHNWVKGKPFDKIRHCILYDFAIHWFDILNCFMGSKKARKVYATWARSPGQIATPKMLAQVGIEYDNAQASLTFDADVRCGGQARNYIAGTAGTLVSGPEGEDPERVTLYTPKGFGKPKLRGRWFPDGFHGTMGELLRAIEEDREPYNSARHNLESLALCFAAVASAESGLPVKPGTVKRLEPAWM